MMTPIYSESDQALITSQEELLEQFDHNFYARCKAEGLADFEAYKALMNSPDRNDLINQLIKSRSVMIPTFTA